MLDGSTILLLGGVVCIPIALIFIVVSIVFLIRLLAGIFSRETLNNMNITDDED